MKTTYTPTPDQISRYLAAKNAGVAELEARLILRDPMSESVTRFSTDEKALATIEQKVNDLQKKLTKRGRQDPTALREALNLLFDKYDFSPLEELTRMVADGGSTFYVTDLNLRKNILAEIAQYVMPKLKAVEIGGKVEHEHTITIVRYGEDGKVNMERPRTVAGPMPSIPIESEVTHG